MTINLRSFGQQDRHAEARKAKDDRRRLVRLLLRQQAMLKIMLGEIRAEFNEIDKNGYLRAGERSVLDLVAELRDQKKSKAKRPTTV